MGRIVVVQGDCLMICHLECAYMAHHPDLSRHFPKLKVLIALKACLSTVVASKRTESWQQQGVAHDVEGE